MKMREFSWNPEYNFVCDPDGTYGHLCTVYDRDPTPVINGLGFAFLWLLTEMSFPSNSQELLNGK